MMNDQMQPQPIYPNPPQRMTFLLRLWPADESAGFNWRASLEYPQTSQRIGFATLEQLFVYLLDLCDGRPPLGTAPSATSQLPNP